MKTKMTKKEAIRQFRVMFPREVFLQTLSYNGTYRVCIDDCARREAWNNYTDSLCKEGRITHRQYDTWSNPF